MSWVFIFLLVYPSIEVIAISSGIFKAANNTIRFSCDKHIQILLNKPTVEASNIFYIYTCFNTQINRITPPKLVILIFDSLSFLASPSFKDPFRLLSFIYSLILLLFLQLTASFSVSTCAYAVTALLFPIGYEQPLSSSNSHLSSIKTISNVEWNLASLPIAETSENNMNPMDVSLFRSISYKMALKIKYLTFFIFKPILSISTSNPLRKGLLLQNYSISLSTRLLVLLSS